MVDGKGSASRVVGGDYEAVQVPQESFSTDELVIVDGLKGKMPYKIMVGAPEKAEEQQALQDKVREIAEGVLDNAIQVFSKYEENSELNKINRLDVGTELKVSKPMAQVLTMVNELVQRTRGAFDPAVGPLLEHYSTAGHVLNRYYNYEQRSDEKADEPGKNDKIEARVISYWQALLKRGFNQKKQNLLEAVEQLRQFSSWAQFIFEPQDGTIKKLHSLAKLDLGGIAKGWAIDELVTMLHKELKIPNLYVEWAGDVKVLGKNPSGKNWTLAIPKPPSVENLLLRAQEAGLSTPNMGDLSLSIGALRQENEGGEGLISVLHLKSGEAVCTSGDYEQVKILRDRLYSHILNPQTGQLSELDEESVAQVSVVTTSAMLSDGLATAALAIRDPVQARALLDPYRTNSSHPMNDFIIYCRGGPRIIHLSVPGIEKASLKAQRLKSHEKGAKVAICGGGLAGLTAAVSAAQAGAQVTIFEKEARTGGNSAKATSGINGWGTVTQAKQGVSDREALFERDTFLSGVGGHSNHSLVRTLSTQSASAIHFLMDTFDIPLTVLSQLGGHSAKRTHRAPPDEQGRPRPIGFTIIQSIQKYIEANLKDSITVRSNCEVQSLISHVDPDDGIKIVEGLIIKNENGEMEKVYADAVILTTGGFGCDRSSNGYMAKYRPDLMSVPTTNGAFAVGQGMRMGEEIGAQLIDMDKVQLHPTGFIDPKDPSNPTKFLAPEMVRGSGGILVNEKGHRFINELDLRSIVAKGIQDHCGPYPISATEQGPPFAWIIMSPEAQELLGLPTLNFYKDRLGLFETAKNVEEAAKIIGCDAQELTNTLREYQSSKDLGVCKTTGKNVFPSSLSEKTENMVLARVTPSVHYTMGGLEINPAAEVQERLLGSVFGSHRSIQRLYAAGEVTGGVHGGNRLGGNSLLECVVFGRIAGERAATVNQRNPVCLVEGEWVPCTLREMRNTDQIYGQNTRVFRFNLHGSLQTSGMKVGQFVSVKGEMDGETLMGYFSPITRPGDNGVIGILCRTDSKGGPIVQLLNYIRPGSSVHIKAMGGIKLDVSREGIFHENRKIERIGLLAGGTGIAPMIQIIRAYFWSKGIHIEQPQPRRNSDNAEYMISNKAKGTLDVNLVYAAEESSDLAFMTILESVEQRHPEEFRFYPILNKPPLGWIQGVGYVAPQNIKENMFYPPEENQLIVICGPPIFETLMCRMLEKLGFPRHLYYAYSQG